MIKLFFRNIQKKALLLYDKWYAKKRFMRKFGRKLNLKNPTTFNEKIQWIKLHKRSKVMTDLADKFKVRKFVSNRIGKKYLNELYSVHSNIDDIDFKVLPKQFVIKANHGSSWNIICKDKRRLNIDSIKRKAKNWVSQNYYFAGREWCYKDIEPKIIIEKFLGENIYDYKFFCFNGEPKYVQVDIDRFVDHKRNIYDLDWNKQKFDLHHVSTSKKIERPENFVEMIEVCRKLSKDFPFVRVDLYSVKDKIYFGELTFYPGNGFERFNPEKGDYIFGEELHLNE